MEKVKTKIRNIINSLTFRVVGSIIILLFAFSAIIEAISYFVFSKSFVDGYKDNTYRIAATAATLINGDNLEEYLENKGKNDEYQNTVDALNTFCNKQNVTMIYVISVDTTNYKSFTSIFNVVNENSNSYTPWEIGYKRQTTNEKYEKAYKSLYNKEKIEATVFRKYNLNNQEPHITTMVPIQNSKKKVVAILCVQRPMSEIKSSRMVFLNLVTGITVLLAIGVSIIAYKFFRKYVVKPVIKISKETERFVNENTKTKKTLDLESSKITEIKILAQSVDKMEFETVNYINNLEKATKENERVGTELKLAKSIQESALTNEFPECDEYSIFASMNPAKEVGGDFYDFYLIDENHLVLTIADVSGKGVPAALFMMITKVLLSSATVNYKTPSEILTSINDQISKKNTTNMFITIWLGILDLRTGKLVYSNAGHEDPVIYRKGADFKIEKTTHGIVVGAFENYKYKDNEITLKKGDKLFLYTDGVPEATNNKNEMFGLDRMVNSSEATNNKNEMFGLDRMVNSLNNNFDKDMESLLKNVKKDVEEFVDRAVQFDDLTMLGLEYKKQEF